MRRTLRTRLAEIAADPRSHLSRLVPVPMSSTYGAEYTITGAAGDAGTFNTRETATWWQWRGRVLRHRVTPAVAG